MRVLALNYEYPPIGGGGGAAHRSLMREWAMIEGLEIDLIAPTPEPAPVIESLSDTARLRLFPFKKRHLHYWRRGEVLRYIQQAHREIRRALREGDYDLCHAFFGFPTGLLAWRLCRDIPYIISVRGSDVPGYNQRFGWDYIVLKPLLKRIYSNAAAVAANSEGLKALYENAFPGLSAGVVPNGVDIETFRPAETAKLDPPAIVSVGRMIPRKGFDLLLRACATLKRKGLNVQCRLVGDGPEEEPLKRLAAELDIADCVRFHGALKREDIAALLPACSVFALPSHAEGMANAALEAMACGLPLLLTDVGGSRELVDGNGAIIPAGDEAALAQTLGGWLKDSDRLAAMSERSRERAMGFSWSNAARQYVELYQQVLKRA